MTGQGIDGVADVSYTYDENGQLEELARSGHYGSEAMSQSYGFTYDTFGNILSTTVGDRTLASYTYAYAQKNGLLSRMTYGNGDYINYAYDRLGRTTEKEIASGSSTRKINYVYNGDGQLHSVKDGSKAYGYTYDTLGRLVGTTLKNGTSLTQQSWRQFDDNNRLTGLSINLPGIGEYSESYVYNSDSTDNISDGTLTQKSLFSGDLLRYTYDSLTRLTQCSIGLLSQEITYCSGTSGQTTALPAQQLIKNGNRAVVGSYSYTYDAVGNITQLQYKPIGAAAGKRTASYTYDELNQLTSAYLPGVLGSSAKSYTYTYDGFGNLLTATSNGVTHTYEYTDSDWGDLLTCYDGEEITYDAIGNPDIYYNGDMMCWSGRQLLERRNGQENTAYSYNADGLRTRRVLTDRSYYESYWLGELLIAETYKKSNGALVYTLVFSYDENGSPVGVSMRNGTSATWTSYDYLKNLQGDILGICSVSGGGIVTIHAAYEYDPWGKLLGVRNNSGGVISDETSIALRNPLRYRGYYYDSDTGYYYLKSRYYDPQIGRFINADGYASTGQGFIGHNMFAYCLNNPILCADESGNAANPRYNVSLVCDGIRPSAARQALKNYVCNSGKFDPDPCYAPTNIRVSVRNSGRCRKDDNGFTTSDTAMSIAGEVSSIGGTGIGHLTDWANEAGQEISPGIEGMGILFKVLGGLVVAYGFIKYAKNYNDIVPIGDYDSYIVTISWDSSFRNFSASQERTILGYTATYRFIWCDAFDDDQFWYLVKYDIQPTYAPLIQ